jgi:large subunit ribosomal protein L13
MATTPTTKTTVPTAKTERAPRVLVSESKTYSAKPTEVTRNWWIVDASEAPLGRMATEVAMRLMGKLKPSFTAHIDCGDWVIITNSDQLVVTGKKSEQKMYYNHSGYPGNLREATLAEVMIKDSKKAVYEAVRGMLPKNKLQPERLARLKIYNGPEHMHAGQTPTVLSIKSNKPSAVKEKA